MEAWNIEKPGEHIVEQTPRMVRVNLPQGSLKISADPGPAVVEVRSLTRGAIPVRGGDELVIGQDFRRPWFWAVRRRWLPDVDLVLTVPPGCDVAVRSIDADVCVTGVRGRLSVRSDTGHTTLRGVAGPTRVISTVGQVRVLDQTGDIDIESVSGSVVLAGCLGSSVRLHSVSGSLTVDMAVPGRMTELLSTSGEVNVRVPGGCGLDVELSTTAGQIASEFEQLSRRMLPAHRTVGGRLGSGGNMLRVVTTSAHIALLEGPDDADEPIM